MGQRSSLTCAIADGKRGRDIFIDLTEAVGVEYNVCIQGLKLSPNPMCNGVTLMKSQLTLLHVFDASANKRHLFRLGQLYGIENPLSIVPSL